MYKKHQVFTIFRLNIATSKQEKYLLRNHMYKYKAPYSINMLREINWDLIPFGQLRS